MRPAMRSPARLALALALLAGFGLAVVGPAQAQEDQREEVAFSSTCLQLQCHFEIGEMPVEEANATEIRWTFGANGTTATGNPVEHTFAEAGTYDVSVTVDAGNETFEGREEVQVSGGEVPWMAVWLGLAALAGSLVLARAT